MSTARPILFSTPMVRALLEGRKTQTRRMFKIDETKGNRLGVWEVSTIGGKGVTDGKGRPVPERPCLWHTRTGACFSPGYGVPGDLLWVRETWSHTGTGVWSISDTYMAQDGNVVYRADSELGLGGWFPSIHMPRRFSRLTLEITNVRVERLQDISKADAEAEGVEFETADPPFYYVPHMPHSITGVGVEEPGGRHAVRCYAKLWDHLNGPGAWDADPWIVALTFTVHKSNVDTYLSQRAEAA